MRLPLRSVLSAPLRVLAAIALVGLLVGCQAKLVVHTTVEADGSGTVEVAVGLDAEAVAKAGDLRSQLRVDDLRAAGWTVTDPTEEADGYTWVRATKPFADASGASAVLDEVNGPDGAFGGWTVKKSSSALSTSYSVSGAVDLTKGLETFSDAQLDQSLGAKGLGGTIAQIEADQGRPVSDMVDVEITVTVPGASHTYTPSLADTDPTPVKVTSSRATGLVNILLLVAVMLIAVPVLLWLRLRMSRRRQPPDRAPHPPRPARSRSS
ncbi:MAG: hypothetical protein ACXV5S_06680 [Acidimicrobiales bacterium]